MGKQNAVARSLGHMLCLCVLSAALFGKGGSEAILPTMSRARDGFENFVVVSLMSLICFTSVRVRRQQLCTLPSVSQVHRGGIGIRELKQTGSEHFGISTYHIPFLMFMCSLYEVNLDSAQVHQSPFPETEVLRCPIGASKWPMQLNVASCLSLRCRTPL